MGRSKAQRRAIREATNLTVYALTMLNHLPRKCSQANLFIQIDVISDYLFDACCKLDELEIKQDE